MYNNVPDLKVNHIRCANLSVKKKKLLIAIKAKDSTSRDVDFEVVSLSTALQFHSCPRTLTSISNCMVVMFHIFHGCLYMIIISDPSLM